jgi:hypothetical protein
MNASKILLLKNLHIRRQVSRAFVAILIAPLISFVPAVLVPTLLPQAHAAVTNGSMSLAKGNSLLVGRFTGDNPYYKLLSTNGFTFEGWIKFSTITSGDNIIFSSCYNGWLCNPVTTMSWNSNGNVNFLGCSSVTTGITPALNTWYNITEVFNGSGSGGGSVFINGVRKATCANGSVGGGGNAEAYVIGGTANTTLQIGPN